MGARERFIISTLETEGWKFERSQGAAIQEAVKIRSGNILSARSIAVSSGDGMDGRLTFTHTIYERFLDMKRRGTVRRRKRRRIHNRFVFGAYSSIAKRLMYGFTEEVAASFRDAAEGLQ